MIRFYYTSGGNPQQNPSQGEDKNKVSPAYQFLTLFYGYWWMMLIEGLVFITAGIYAVFQGILLSTNVPYSLPYTMTVLIGMILAVFGIIYYLLGSKIQKSGGIGGLLKFRGGLESIIGVILLLTPNLSSFLFFTMLAFFLFSTGMSLLMSR